MEVFRVQGEDINTGIVNNDKNCDNDNVCATWFFIIFSMRNQLFYAIFIKPARTLSKITLAWFSFALIFFFLRLRRFVLHVYNFLGVHNLLRIFYFNVKLVLRLQLAFACDVNSCVRELILLNNKPFWNGLSYFYDVSTNYEMHSNNEVLNYFHRKEMQSGVVNLRRIFIHFHLKLNRPSRMKKKPI